MRRLMFHPGHQNPGAALGAGGHPYAVRVHRSCAARAETRKRYQCARRFRPRLQRDQPVAPTDKGGCPAARLPQGGRHAPNIIPERTTGEFLVRAREHGLYGRVVQKVKTSFSGGPRTGCRAEPHFTEEPYSDLRNNASWLTCSRRTSGASARSGSKACPGKMLARPDMGNVSHWSRALHPTVAIASADVAGQLAGLPGSLRSLRAIRP